MSNIRVIYLVTNGLLGSVQTAWHAPVFSSVLANRRDLMMIASVGVLHLGASLAGVTLWNCPIREATGIPCPGCGLTRASLELLRGDFSRSFEIHAFAPAMLGVIAIMLLMLFLPESVREAWIAHIRKSEVRFGITAWFVTLLVLYWAFRLLGFPPFPNNF